MREEEREQDLREREVWAEEDVTGQLKHGIIKA